MPPRSLRILLLLACALATACGDKKKAPDPAVEARLVEGLAAIPAEARVLLGLNVAALRDSPLVRRAVSQLFARDPELRARVDDLITRCQLDPAADLAGFVVGMGSAPTEVVMVASGRFDEAKLVACVGESVTAGGGAVVERPGADRKIYMVEDQAGQGGRVWFTFGGPRTVIVAASEAWLLAAIGDGKKVGDRAELIALVDRAKPTSGLWAAGLVDPEVGQGLLRVTAGKVEQPPAAMFGHLEVGEGLHAELGVVMAGEADAQAVVSFANAQLGVLAVMAQEQGLGPLVSKIQAIQDAKTVFLRLVLSAAEVEELARQIDTMAGPDKNRGG